MAQLASRVVQQWHPQKYLAFERYRLRPALELLANVTSLPSSQSDDVAILDLGAGSGNMAPAFVKRWPKAHVTFLDSSASMLEHGKAQHAANPELDASRFEYVQATFESFEPSRPLDLVFSNAAIQWVDSDAHKVLIPRLFSFLKPGGVLAIQIPDVSLQPSHQLLEETTRQLGLERDLGKLHRFTPESKPEFYYPIFQGLLSPEDITLHLNMWSTIYAQIVEGENPVADFTWSTSLGPYLEALGGREAPRAKQFEDKYRELIAQAYPKQQDGRTIFNYKRFFMVATKPSTTA
ncbi:hypothetical protein Poli38472_003081 [Pythium oligandrum]|uniref:Methyltransferase domain-containing protein n=1 Tax=Pythium oligandrum TaxID=41045 RepID=A0A8K1C5W1_PYTOL|nr:hypothetical protein Poli38472_003081 [Pythium oligandrum]|eukprot:TMW57156.1 hypothetical protein Poli38472_003081 [Pythium oligandrum]